MLILWIYMESFY